MFTVQRSVCELTSEVCIPKDEEARDLGVKEELVDYLGQEKRRLRRADLLGPFLMPFETYLWRLAQLGVMLVLGILANAGGLVGAGDAKFVAAAAPYVAAGDLRFVLALFTANLLAAFATHRLAKHSGLRRLAPDWESWSRGRDFPMGLALGGTLSLYLLLGIFLGG